LAESQGSLTRTKKVETLTDQSKQLLKETVEVTTNQAMEMTATSTFTLNLSFLKLQQTHHKAEVVSKHTVLLNSNYFSFNRSKKITSWIPEQQ